MPEETRTALVALYEEIAFSSQRFSESLERVVNHQDLTETPSDRAYVSTLRQSLGELSIVASIAYERGKPTP